MNALEKPLKLVGKTVYLEEIQPKYFDYVIRWRNNRKLNRFLNQPNELTLDLQRQWFQEYRNDCTQGLLIAIDPLDQRPFGTVGWTNWDEEQKHCIMGRLLIGEERYMGDDKYKEAVLLVSDYLYDILRVEMMYLYTVEDNERSIKFNKKFGYVKTELPIKFPKEILVNQMKQIGFCRSKEEYMKIRKGLYRSFQKLL